MKNNHQLICTALEAGLEAADFLLDKQVALEVPQIFNAELEPISTVVIVKIDGTAYSGTDGASDEEEVHTFVEAEVLQLNVTLGEK